MVAEAVAGAGQRLRNADNRTDKTGREEYTL
jgi:hypothetical protein